MRNIILFAIFCILSVNLIAQEKQENDVSGFEIVEHKILPINNDHTIQVDTTFIYKSDTINIVIENECLFDSLLTFALYDTNYTTEKIYKTTFINHNANINIYITRNNKTKKHSINKMDFDEKMNTDVLKISSSIDINLELILHNKSEILFTVLFRLPYSDVPQRSAYAVYDWKKKKIKFIGKNTDYCASLLQAIEDKAIITCSSVVDFTGKPIMIFDESAIFCEFLDSNSFIVINDLMKAETDSTGFTNYYFDEISDNAFVYNLEGELKYSFRYENNFVALYYYIPIIRQKETNQLFLLDFSKSKYFIPKAEGVEIKELYCVANKLFLTDYKKFRVYDNGVYDLYIKDSDVVFMMPEKEEEKDIKLQTKQNIDVSNFSQNSYYLNPYNITNSVEIDTSFKYKSEKISLSIERECLRDSLLTYIEYDTNYYSEELTERICICHNGNINISLIRNNKKEIHSINKLLFAEKIKLEMIKASTAYNIELVSIFKNEPKIVFTIVFGFPSSDVMEEVYVVYNWETMEICFFENNSNKCASSLQVIEGKAIVSSEALLKTNGEIIKEFDDNVAYSGFLDSSNIIVIYDYNAKNEMQSYNTQNSNAFVYSVDGALKYSFVFEGAYQELTYIVSHIIDRKTNQLVLLDFKNKIFYLPKGDYIEAFELKEFATENNIDEYELYKVYNLWGQFTIFVRGEEVFSLLNCKFLVR